MKAILWDMDGSLINSEPIWEVATYDLSEYVGRRITPELRQKTIGNHLRGTLQIIADHAGRVLDDQLLADGGAFLENRFLELVREQGVTWREGAKELLTAVRTEDIPVVLVTNTRRHVAQVSIDAMTADALGDDLFTTTVCGDEVPHGKPHPDPYLRGAELAGFAPEECLAIEDSATGVKSAIAAECQVLWNQMPELASSPAQIAEFSPPAKYFSGSWSGWDTQNLRAAFASDTQAWNNRTREKL